jgi:hypothetical protein
MFSAETPENRKNYRLWQIRTDKLLWRSCTGDVSPAFYEPEGDAWHRLFYGGMVITCGLTNVGAPCVDQGEELGRHERISATPAESVCATVINEKRPLGIYIRYRKDQLKNLAQWKMLVKGDALKFFTLYELKSYLFTSSLQLSFTLRRSHQRPIL